MNRRTRKYIADVEAQQYALGNRFEEIMKTITPAEIRETMIRAGIMTKKGNVTARYRQAFIDHGLRLRFDL